ncbi:MAG: hypothetical protein H6819_00220 [Phycisphaerales bacterium]|nr:hypothetical protein [Phycisphaerales bacterium]MCB9857367.1 hypothetical protein [Phycisphaerales bacterium]
MEHAFLDGKLLATDGIGADAKVSSVVERAKTTLKDGAGDSILLEVICDGEAIEAAHLEATLAEPLSRYARLEFVSGSRRTVVVESLTASKRSIGDTFELVREAADQLNAGSVASGMQRLIDCVEIWSQAHEAMISSGQLLELDLEELVIADKHVFEWLREPAVKLREIRDAIESRDHVNLVDILRYEMDDFLQGWEKMLEAYVEYVSRLEIAA